MKEYILSFLPEQFVAPEQFRVELAGITFPFADYQVDRWQSLVTTIEFVIAGKGEVRIDDHRFQVQAGDCYLLPAGHDHWYRSDDRQPLHKIWINVAGTVVEQLLQAYHLHQHYHFPQTDRFALFNQLLALCEQAPMTPTQRSRHCSLLFHELLISLAETLPQSHQLVPADLWRAKVYLDNHLQAGNVSVAAVARTANLSTSQLTRQFKRWFHQTPYEYYLTKKIQLAQLLLKETLLSVQEIADRLGFSDEHYFSNLFRQKTGYSPTGWRRRGQPEKTKS